MEKIVNPTRKVRGTLRMPPDKSISHRAAMFAALADGTSVFRNFSQAEDPQTTLKCLRQLGVSIEESGTTVEVRGKGRSAFRNPEIDVDCGNSGTTMRLLSGIIGGAGISATLIGDDSLSARPMKRIIEPLEKMGIHINARDEKFAPLEISRKKPVVSITYELPVASAQVKSCILLAGLYGEGKTTVIERIPSRNHTELMLGLPISYQSGQVVLQSSAEHQIPLLNFTVPGDFSAAAFWMVAAGINEGSELTLENTGINATRTALLHILRRMGAEIQITNPRKEGGEDVADLIIKGKGLKGSEVLEKEIPNCIDELPILAVAMCFADGESSFRHAADLRHKETDRIMAIVHILKQAGADFQEHEDGITILGNPGFVPRAAIYNSFHDHRIAMASAIMAGKSAGSSTVQYAESAAISYPGFWEHLALVSQ